MPIAPVAPNPSLPSGLLADAGEAPSATTVTATAADGFAAVLAAAQGATTVDPRTLPSVSLDQMVASVAGLPLTAPLPVNAPEAATAAGAAGAAGVAGAGAASGVGNAGGAGSSTSASGDGARILAAGERYLGTPYKWGGTSARTGFDCSGFTQQVFSDLGVRLPRVSVDQSKSGTAVASMAEARPGDLLFFRSTNGRPNHIGIYAGNNKMLHSPRTGDVVRYQELNRTPAAIRRVQI